jgi:hypothetical protein
VSVLVLEAGRANLNDDTISAFPSNSYCSFSSQMRVAMSGTFGKAFCQPDYDWGFMTVRITSMHKSPRMTLLHVVTTSGPSKAQQ